MIEFETNRLKIKSESYIQNGKIESKKGTLNLDELEPSNGHNKAFCIFLKNDNKEIGAIDIYDKWCENELNVRIHNDEDKKQGYMSEALNGLLDYLSENTIIKKVYGVISKDNIASIKTVEKCGFVKAEEQSINGTYTYICNIDERTV